MLNKFGLNIITKGAKEIQAKHERLKRALPAAELTAMRKAVLLVVRGAKKKLTGGNPLNVRSGRLRSSVVSEVRKKGRAEIEGEVGTDVFYGEVHERGMVIKAKNKAMRFFYKGQWRTKTSVRIPKREWLRPSMEQARPRIFDLFNRATKDAIRKAGL